MTSRSPQDILQELENDVTNRHYGRADVMHEVAAGNERAGDEEKAGNLRAEAAACSGATPQRRLDGPGGYSCRCGEQGSPLGAGRRSSSARSPTTSRVLWQRATPRRC